MNYVLTLDDVELCWPVRDRSLEAQTTQSSPVEQSPRFERGDEIFALVVRALGRAAKGDDTLPLGGEVLASTLDILSMLPTRFPLPEVVIESEKEVGLDWDLGKRRVLSLTVDGTPMVGFSALLGTEPLVGKLSFAEGVPETLSFYLARLFPQAKQR